MSAPARLRRLERVAHVLDDAFEIPFVGRRIGVDALIGLVPVAGDVIGGALSSWVLYNGFRLGASWLTLLRMTGNILIEVLLGAVPLVGDLFDIGFKANLRNVRLLLAYGDDAAAVDRRSAWLAWLIVGGFALLLIGAAVLAGWIAVTAIAALAALVGAI